MHTGAMFNLTMFKDHYFFFFQMETLSMYWLRSNYSFRMKLHSGWGQEYCCFYGFSSPSPLPEGLKICLRHYLKDNSRSYFRWTCKTGQVKMFSVQFFWDAETFTTRGHALPACVGYALIADVIQELHWFSFNERLIHFPLSGALCERKFEGKLSR